MISSLGEIISLFSTAFITPFVVATEPIPLPLPQPINYVQQMRSQINGVPFSTDPKAQQGMVLAEQTSSPKLEGFIISYKECIAAGDILVYRLFIANKGDVAANNVLVTFHYNGNQLAYKTSLPPPLEDTDPTDGQITWLLPVIPAASGQEILVTFDVNAPSPTFTYLDIEGENHEGNVISQHTAPGCPSQPNLGERPLPDKQPAIICDRGELNCQQIIPSLGFNFKRAFENTRLQPTICSSDDPDGCTPNMPPLGARFAEAVADILPGDCSVLPDDIVTTPEYQDAFNRQGEVSTPLLIPLYKSSQDFKQLMHENGLLGIIHNQTARTILKSIHTRHWQNQAHDIRAVLNGSAPSSSVRSKVNSYHTNWQRDTREAQRNIARTYSEMQNQRQAKFDPIGQAAVENADEAFKKACGPRDVTSFSNALFVGDNSVKKRYNDSLNAREDAFATTQRHFVSPPGSLLPEIHRPATWQEHLRRALDSFDQGNEEPLKTYLNLIPEQDRIGFESIWSRTYIVHAENDFKADDRIRLQNWQVALRSPKAQVTQCAKDQTFAAPVELTWCESADYSEFVIRDASHTTKSINKYIKPPTLIGGGENAQIDPERVVGVSCGGRRGDPFWSYDCSCSCDDIVVPKPGSNNIKLCQATGEPEGGEDSEQSFPFDPRFSVNDQIGRLRIAPPPGTDPNQGPSAPVGEPQGEFLPIIRHDLSPMTSREECLRETARHTQPNPEDRERIRF